MFEFYTSQNSRIPKHTELKKLAVSDDQIGSRPNFSQITPVFNKHHSKIIEWCITNYSSPISKNTSQAAKWLQSGQQFDLKTSRIQVARWIRRICANTIRIFGGETFFSLKLCGLALLESDLDSRSGICWCVSQNHFGYCWTGFRETEIQALKFFSLKLFVKVLLESKLWNFSLRIIFDELPAICEPIAEFKGFEFQTL